MKQLVLAVVVGALAGFSSGLPEENQPPTPLGTINSSHLDNTTSSSDDSSAVRCVGRASEPTQRSGLERECRADDHSSAFACDHNLPYAGARFRASLTVSPFI